MAALLLTLWSFAALAWGVVAPPVWFSFEPAGAYGVSPYTAAAAGMDGAGVCQVLIFPAFEMETPEATGLTLSQDEIWTRALEHEMGHCLGFADAPGDDSTIMGSWEQGVTAADLAALHH